MSTPDAFLPPGFDTAEQYIESLVSFIDKYRWLYEVHVVDILPYKQWELLDPSWREALLTDSDHDDWFETIISLPSFDRKAVCDNIKYGAQGMMHKRIFNDYTIETWMAWFSQGIHTYDSIDSIIKVHLYKALSMLDSCRSNING